MPPLVVALDTLPSEGRSFVLRLSPEEVDQGLAVGEVDEVRAAPGGVQADLRVLPSGTEVFVVGRVAGRFRYTCGRCLGAFERDLDLPVHATYSVAAEGGGDQELRVEDLEIEVCEGGQLDLTKTVFDQIFLGLDVYPVCKEDCRGLCPRCGADRNTAACACPSEGPDPRLAVLAAWKGRVSTTG